MLSTTAESAGIYHSEAATRMSQATLEEAGLRQTKPSKSPKRKSKPKSIANLHCQDDVDYSTTDFTEHLQEDIKAARKRKEPPLEGSVLVEQEETEKFLKKAKVCFLGQNVKNEHTKTRDQIVSQKETFFNNKTEEVVDYTFRSKNQHATTAQLTTKKGFKIGALAFVGGGAGGQGGLGVGAEYSRGTESMEQLSNASGREVQVLVRVPNGGSAKVVEKDYSTVYDAECDFDIAIEDSHTIRYSVGRRKFQMKAKELKKEDDPDDTVTRRKVRSPITYVHLHRSCKCKLVTIEHELDIEMKPAIEKTEHDANTPDS